MNIAYFLLPKNSVAYLYDDCTFRQGLEKMRHHGYTAIPVISRDGKYVGTVSEGDFLWRLLSKESDTLTAYSMKDMEQLEIRDILRGNSYPSVRITVTMEALLQSAMNQNFIPVVDDLGTFIGIVTRKDIIRYFVGPEYFAGLTVVPIIMLAELFSGIFFNLSLWYKLTDRTQWGVYFSFIGLAVIVAGNVLFVPRFGYIACAWSAFACFFAMMFFSWLVGQKYYPIRYDLKGMARYAVLALALYALGTGIPIDNMALRLGFRTLLLCLYVLYVIRKDSIAEKRYVQTGPDNLDGSGVSCIACRRSVRC